MEQDKETLQRAKKFAKSWWEYYASEFCCSPYEADPQRFEEAWEKEVIKGESDE